MTRPTKRQDRYAAWPDLMGSTKTASKTTVATPDIPNWSSKVNVSTGDRIQATQEEIDSIKVPKCALNVQRLYRNRRVVTNQAPQRHCATGYDTWKSAYISHILLMYDIFMRGMKKMEVDDSVTHTPVNIEMFSRFIHSVSSGQVATGLVPHTSEEYDVYR